jgi:hypothetical protein
MGERVEAGLAVQMSDSVKFISTGGLFALVE